MSVTHMEAIRVQKLSQPKDSIFRICQKIENLAFMQKNPRE